jgi:hypothetical protein
MDKYQDMYHAHQRARFMRPDAARYIRPDVVRFLRPGTDPAEVFPALALKYSPTQRRIAAGRPGGGRWTDEADGGGGGGMPVAAGDADPNGEAVFDDAGVLAYGDDVSTVAFDTGDWTGDSPGDDAGDAERAQIIRTGEGNNLVLNEFGEPYYQSGGHHEMVKSIYEKWNLQPETRRIFEESTTGVLPKGRVLTGPDGELRGHFWDGPHREYKDAVMELSNRFLRDHDIMDTSRMTPAQAQDLLAEIRRSENPAIRDFNRAMRLIGRNFRLRFGRGNQ